MPAGKPLPGSWVKETWPDLDPPRGRTLNLQSLLSSGHRGLGPKTSFLEPQANPALIPGLAVEGEEHGFPRQVAWT